MEGYSFKLDIWDKWLPLAVQGGYVSKQDATMVRHGIEFGFDLGVNEEKMGPVKVRKNYASALGDAAQISDALRKRVTAGKSVCLGAWDRRAGFPSGSDKGCNVPQGSVPKKLEPHVKRPVSDHTKTGLNSALDLSGLTHSLDTYAEIARELKSGYSMRVEDVDGAFPLLPLSPKVWKYMYVIWFDINIPLEDQREPNTLYMHIFGDFGTAAMPGIWDMFWRCVKGMARAAGILTLPMPHYVDDNSLIGPDAHLVNREAEKLGSFITSLGPTFKGLKSRKAACLQLVLGFWWDSIARTRTLEPEKRDLYLAHLESASVAKWLTLKDLQVLAGRMQRASMTMPPRAIVYLANILKLMSGLKYPWHRRRVPAALRKDLHVLIRSLRHNQGRGYFCYDHFERAPAVYTDASKEASYAGGGYFSLCGTYDYWIFGSSAKRQPIDYLEGAAVLRAAENLGPTWRKKVVPIFIDNSAFQGAFRKGRSSAPRLNTLLRQLFHLSVQYDCVFEPTWISTHDNIFADTLSRGRLCAFQDHIRQHFGGDFHIQRYRGC